MIDFNLKGVRLKNNILPIVNDKPNFCISFSLEKLPKFMSFLLLICLAWGFYKFGWYVLILSVSTVSLSIFLDFTFLRFSKKMQNTNKNYLLSQSIMNGLLISLIQNPDVFFLIPLLIVIITFIIKISFNFTNTWINPLLFSLLFSYIAFESNYTISKNPDSVSGASILNLRKRINFKQTDLEKSLNYPNMDKDKILTAKLNSNFFSKIKLNISYIYMKLLFNQNQSIGGSSPILLIMIYIFLYSSNIIKYFLPSFSYFLSFVFFVYTFGGLFSEGFSLTNLFKGTPLIDVLSGGFLFSIVFITSNTFLLPISRFSMILYGFFSGMFLFLFRYLSPYPDGIIFAICLSALFVKIVKDLFSKNLRSVN